MTLSHAHYIRLRYHGPTNSRGARVSATWAGWPSNDSKPVRKYIPYDYGDRDAMAMQAAELFCEWLTDPAANYHFHPEEVILADAGGRDWALLVKTATNSNE